MESMRTDMAGKIPNLAIRERRMSCALRLGIHDRVARAGGERLKAERDLRGRLRLTFHVGEVFRLGDAATDEGRRNDRAAAAVCADRRDSKTARRAWRTGVVGIGHGRNV